MARTTYAINTHVMHVSRNVGPMEPVCKNRRAVYCTRASNFFDAPEAKCAKCQAVFDKWQAKKRAA